MTRLTTMDATERRWSMAAAAVGALTSIILWAPAFDRQAGVVLALIGVAMSALLALAARAGSRLLTGIAAVLLSFGPWGFAWIVGVPYLVLAGWLAVRAGRARAAAAVTAPAVEERAAPATGARRSTRPEPNKRYTPPQHPR
ncbi:MAG: hypothetical protein M3Q48_09485 [Actinomycetota bacterium]|nr:hypothetical protein [Actinomycetota bacterium]